MQKMNYLKGLAMALLLVCSDTQASAKLEPVGVAVYTETARDIYIAALLLPPGSRVENIPLAPGPKAMEYRIALRRMSSRGLSGTLLLQAELGSGSRAPEKAIAAVSTLKNNIKSALKLGDRFVIALSADGMTSFALNGVELLSIDDSSIFDFFLAGWIGTTSSASLRDVLLSGNIDAGTLTQFESLAPTNERLATVSAWVASPPTPSSAPVTTVKAAKTPTPAPRATKTPVAKTTQVAMAKATAANPGASIVDDRDYQRQLNEYVTHIMKKVFRKVVYPRRAIQRDRQGKVELLVTVDEDGNLLDISLDNSSGYGILDSAASKAVRKAAPFPELTLVAKEEFLADDGASYIMPIPITFRLDN